MMEELDNYSRLKSIRYPVCDNCKRPIYTIGFYIMIDGVYCYVHSTYNSKTKECKNVKKRP